MILSHNLTAKLLGNGDYYLELNAEEDMTVTLTISIEKDDGTIDFSYDGTDNNTLDDAKAESVVIIDLQNQRKVCL